MSEYLTYVPKEYQEAKGVDLNRLDGEALLVTGIRALAENQIGPLEARKIVADAADILIGLV